MLLSNFHFLRPWWLLMLIPLALVIWKLHHDRSTGDNWKNVCDQHLLPHLMIHYHSKRSILVTSLLTIAGFIAIFSLAGPTWSRIEQPVFRSQTARVIALNLAQSMYAKDLSPNRLTRTKYKVLDLLKHFRDGQTGMIAFTQEPFVVSPLTQDTQTIAAMIPTLSPNIMPIAGSHISSALTKSKQLMEQAGVRKGTIFLFTDHAPSQEDMAIAKHLHQQGFTLAVLGTGTKQGGPITSPQGGFLTNDQGQTIIAQLPTQQLKLLSQNGGGRYATFTNDNQDIDYLIDASPSASITAAKKTKATTDRWHDQGRLFILLLLPLALLAFRKGWMEVLSR